MNKTFDENIQDIRAAKRGSDVREAMAESLEYVKDYAEAMPGQVDAAADSAKKAEAAQSAAAQSASNAASSAGSAGTSAEAASSGAAAAAASAKAAKASEDRAKQEADRASAIVKTDKTLSVEGAAADAAAVGEALDNYLGIWPVTLPADGWADCDDVPGYAHKQTAELRAAREANVPSAVPTPETFQTAVTAGLAGVCETADGSITFWAENVPEGDIQMQVSLLGQNPDSAADQTDSGTLGDTTLGDMTL